MPGSTCNEVLLISSAESEMFAGFVRRGQATRRYAAGHAVYLADEIGDSAKKLDEAAPEPGAAASVRESRNFLAAARASLEKAKPAAPKAPRKK